MPDDIKVAVIGKTGGLMEIKADMTANSDDNLATQKAVVTEIALNMATVAYNGRKSYGVLSVPTNVVDGQTVTIGTDVFEVDIINTDSTDVTAGGVWNNITDPLTLDLTSLSAAVTGLVVGNLIRIGNEILKITAKNGPWFTFARGRCGTTTAAHANSVGIYVSNAAPAANISVGMVTTLTPTVFLNAIVDEINADVGGATQSAALTAYNVGNEALVIIADAVGTTALATTETLSGSNNVWVTGSTMVAGLAAPTSRKWLAKTLTPTTTDVTRTFIQVPVDFTPNYFVVQAYTTATGVQLAWDGGALYSSGPPKLLTIGIGTSTPVSTNSYLNIFAVE